MKSRLFALIVLFGGPASLAVAQDVPIEIVGELGVRDRKMLSLHETTTGEVAWVGIGGFFKGYRLAIYDAATKTARLERDGKEHDISWRTTRTAKRAELSAAEQQRIHGSVLRNLRQLSSAADQYYLENGVNTVTLDKLIGPTKYIKRLDPVDGEDYGKIELRQGYGLKVTTAHGIVVEYSF